MIKAELFDSVQLIYELVLAKDEILSFNVFPKFSGDFKTVWIQDSCDVDYVLKRTAYIKSIEGEYSDYFYITRRNRTQNPNLYLVHWIYPYKGRFHAQMIRALMNIIGIKKGETVLDPFVGSGTTALEAQLLGINSIGIDISPLCVLQARVRTQSIDIIDKVIEIKNVIGNNPEEDFVRRIISEIRDERARNFVEIVFLKSISDKVRRKKKFQEAFEKNFEEMIISFSDYIDVKNQLNLELGTSDIRLGDARELPIASESVDGIITSPPYSVALDYVQNDAHALSWMGVNMPELKQKMIGIRGKGRSKINLYFEDILLSVKEMYRVLKPRKYAVVVVGNAKFEKKEIDNIGAVKRAGLQAGFNLSKTISKLIWGANNRIHNEEVIIFQK